MNPHQTAYLLALGAFGAVTAVHFLLSRRREVLPAA